MKKKKAKKKKSKTFSFITEVGTEPWDFNPLVKLPVLSTTYLPSFLFQEGETVKVTVISNLI